MIGGAFSQLDYYFDALSDQRRRYALYYLSQRDSANVDELARQVTAWEMGRLPATLTAKTYEPTRVELQHNHLPRLADYGLVEFDSRTNEVRFREPTRAFMALLRVSQLIERRP